MKTNTTKKVISIMLTIFMLITMAPLSAFAAEEYPEIKPGDNYTVTKYEYVKFVPTVSGKYIIRSVSDSDPTVKICDSDMSHLADEDDSDYRENDLDFYLEYNFTAGETYYIEFYDHKGTYNYTVILDPPCSEHVDEDGNNFCDACNEFLGNEIKPGDTYTVTKQEYVKFVPDESGKFIIRSVSDVDPMVTLYDSNMSQLTQEDDSYYREENHLDFYFEYEYTAGETYYFAFLDYQYEYNYTVILFAPCIEHTGGTQTCKGYQCEICGEWYGEGTGEHIDEDENGFCDVCNEFLGNEIKAGDTYTVTKYEYVKFVPTVSGKFIIRSVSDTDPRVKLYDSNMSYLDDEDDSDYRENDLDFYLEYNFTAGETYYFEFYDHDGEYNYTVILVAPCIEHTGGTQTCMGYKCDVCKEWYGEGTGVHIDEDGNSVCDDCDTFVGNEIKAGDTYTVTKGEYVKFVPIVSGKFIIRSVSDTDPRVELRDSDMLYLDNEDDSYYRENGYDFYFVYEYTAGETYYFYLTDCNEDYNYTVILVAPCVEHTGGTQTCKGYQCEVCYEWYGEAGDHVLDTEQTCIGYQCEVCEEWFGEPDETNHGWYFGECEYCGIEYPADLECEHFYSPENSYKCTTCGVMCPHETIENGVCTDCLYRVPFLLTTGENVTYHGSFADALYYAEDGSVIKLLRDYGGYYSVEINKAITFDLNGKEWIQPSSGQFAINAPVHFTDSVGGGYLDYGLNLYSAVTFSGGSYRYIWIDFETEDTLGDYLADGYDYFDYNTDEVLDLSSEKHAPNAVIKFNDRFTGIKDDHFYKNDIMQKAYQLVEFQGDFYFIGDRHEIIKNKTAYLNEARINGLTYADGTPIEVGYYEFDENGKMIMREGLVGNHIYKDNTMLKAYQLVELDGDFYFIGDRHEIIKNKTAYLNEARINGLTYADGTPIAVGYYDFGEDGKMIMREGLVGNKIYKNNTMLKAYQLVEFDGDFYFISDRHEIVKNQKIYLNEARINGLTYADGTPIVPGCYDFDKTGKMVILNGVVGNNIYKNNTKLKAYQLVELDGDFYFIGDRHEIVKNQRVYLNEARINGLTYADGTPIATGFYNVDADGKLITE